MPKAGIPLYTDIKSQYSTHTDIVVHNANIKADAFSDTKLIMKPLITGATNLQVKSIRLITEFISASKLGGWPSDITTNLFLKTNNKKELQVLLFNFMFSFKGLWAINYHSLSIRMVPANVESTPTAPEMFVNITRAMNATIFVNFRLGNTSKATTAPPAIMKERFWVTNHS